MTATDQQEAFREAEASLRLEDLDPSGSEPYESLKAQVIAGKLSIEQAEAATLAHFQNLAAHFTARAS